MPLKLRSRLRLRPLAVLSSLLVAGFGVGNPRAAATPVKIFVLAGQSNMLGQGKMDPVGTPGTLAYIVANEAGTYGFLSDGAGGWTERGDVWIKDQYDHAGDLTAGYGSGSTTIGPELGFGHAAGDQYENQVLIVKAAWGGKSLAVDFRPPSSGGTTGFYYNEILRLVNDAIDNLGTYFPGYNATNGYEIAGFGWHQGWNDRVTAAYSAEYETNMVNFIRDIRTDLGVPGLPFVIATTGMDGTTAYTQVEQAQLAMTNTMLYADFSNNVAVVDTRSIYDGMVFWQPTELSPSGAGYHWNNNARTYVNIGLAMGDAMSQLAPGRCPSRLRAAGGPGGVTLTWQNGSETPTSVRVLRNGTELAAAAPVTPARFVDAGAEPGRIDYELQFTMPGDPCSPLTVTFNGGITALEAFRTPSGVGLAWLNNMPYDAIEVRRDGGLLEGALSGSATGYTDTAPPSSGTVIYSVAPTHGSAAPATVQINLDGPPAGNALVYEPFDYPVGGLDGQGGAAQTGLDGTWNANATTLVVAGTLTYGDLPVGGAKLSDFTAGQNKYGGARAIRAAALAGRGLLADGTNLWFSVLVGYDTGGNLTNTRLALALANNQFSPGNYDYWIADEVGQAGSGIGLTLGRIGGVNGRVVATQFRDLAAGDGLGGVVLGSWTGTGTIYREGEYGLIVGKIAWGAASDTIELYQPGTDLVLPASPISVLTVSVDQSTFDTITFARGDKSMLDEIRFGATYDDVTGAGTPARDYHTWTGKWPTVDLSDPAADYDGDGQSNDAERVWGLDPTSGASRDPISGALRSDGTFTYTRRAAALTGASFTVWTSTDLQTWTEDTGAVQLAGPPNADNVETVTVTLSAALRTEPKLFVHMRYLE